MEGGFGARGDDDSRGVGVSSPARLEGASSRTRKGNGRLFASKGGGARKPKKPTRRTRKKENPAGSTVSSSSRLEALAALARPRVRPGSPPREPPPRFRARPAPESTRARPFSGAREVGPYPRAWTTTRARSNATRSRVRDETLRRWSGKRTMTRFFVGGRVGIQRGSRRSLRRRSPATTRSRSTGRRTPGGAASSLSRARRREGRSRAPSPRCRPRPRCSSSSKGSARSGRGGNASPRGVVCSDDLASPTRRDGEGFCFRDETRSPWE